MMNKFIDQLGDWNPQLLRELKGRFKILPVIVAAAASLISQFVLVLMQFQDLPDERYPVYGEYCKIRNTFEQQQRQLSVQLTAKYNELQQLFKRYSSPGEYDAAKLKEIKAQLQQVQTEQNNIYTIRQNFCPLDQIDMQMWWRDHWEYVFMGLSAIFIFTLLVAGTYLLINNLAQEERRGTLNFLRLSPQPETNILVGKLLGVPILIYFAVALAIPLHLIAARQAKIALSYVACFYVVLLASCIFFYSAALLFGIVGKLFGGFQPWLGSGIVLLFLSIAFSLTSSSSYYHDPSIWLRSFSPFDMTNYLFPNFPGRHRHSSPYLSNLKFFNLPIGQSAFGLVGFHLFNYGLWSYWIWQGLKRCFRNPNTTIISKQHSYYIVAIFEVINLGFLAQQHVTDKYASQMYRFFESIGWLYLLNLALFIGLIAILSPHRQPIIDWERYRYQNERLKNNLWSDLIWGEKSPAILAIAINLLIAGAAFVYQILLMKAPNADNSYKSQALIGVALTISLILIYATVTQIILMMKNRRRGLWAAGTLTALLVVPPFILSLLRVDGGNILWLFSSYPWYGIQYCHFTTILIAFLCQAVMITVLVLHLQGRIKSAGESATQALFAKS